MDTSTRPQVDHFSVAFELTMELEGKLSNDRQDKGGQTYCGISRVYWPDWQGWIFVDEWIDCGDMSELLPGLVRQFYRVNFWNRMQGDKLAAISPKLAYEVFDSAVNMDVSSAIRFLQTGYNVGSGDSEELIVDGKLGPKTIETLKRYFSSQPGSREINQEILLNCMNGEQYIHYKNNPQHKRYRGWFRRL